jgi:hypothetical protein
MYLHLTRTIHETRQPIDSCERNESHVAKARRQGAAALPAYRLQCPTHVPFLTSAFAYAKYVEYWNNKVMDLLGDLRGQSKSSET